MSPLSTIDHYTTPLVIRNQHPFLPTIYESGDSFNHSVSSSSVQVTNSWIINVQQHQQQQQNQQDTKENEEETIKDNSSSVGVHDEDQLDEQGEGEKSDLEEERALALENLADSLDHDKVRDYISNSGAYSRGEGLLHIWILIEYFWQDESRLVTIFGKAKGTSDTPYQVYAKLDRDDHDQVIKGGFCSCPVGKNGRCKHVTALLLRFMINVDDFEPAQESIIVPMVEKDLVTKSSTPQVATPNVTLKTPSSTSTSLKVGDIHTNSTINTPEAAALPPVDASLTSMETSTKATDVSTLDLSAPTTITPSESVDTNIITPSNSLPQRRRVLPWLMEQQKVGRGTKKQRTSKASTSTTLLNHSIKTENNPSPSSAETTKATTTTTKKKPTASKKPRTKSDKAKKGPVWTEDFSDSDSNLWHDDQASDTTKPAKRSPRKRTYKQRNATTAPSYNIDDSIMLSDDDDPVLGSTTRLQSSMPPPTLSATGTDIYMISEDEDTDNKEIITGSYVYTPASFMSNQSPINTMQNSSLSLPMIDLALLSSKADGSETEDEDEDEDKDEDKYETLPKHQPTSQQQQDMEHDKTDLPDSPTSALFDELGL
ncbi:hypothetical protein BC941DRAFT_5024 [Chlamydoabsidia padenii]|nr:hypothetical protein BC941DRAFT_5024 [Chlamydoabsidia padenii]